MWPTPTTTRIEDKTSQPAVDAKAPKMDDNNKQKAEAPEQKKKKQRPVSRSDLTMGMSSEGHIRGGGYHSAHDIYSP